MTDKKVCQHHWTVTSECPKCLREELDEIEHVFEMQRAAEKRAEAMWCEGHPEREIVLPDRANLVLFLLKRIKELEGALALALGDGVVPNMEKPHV